MEKVNLDELEATLNKRLKFIEKTGMTYDNYLKESCVILDELINLSKKKEDKESVLKYRYKQLDMKLQLYLYIPTDKLKYDLVNGYDQLATDYLSGIGDFEMAETCLLAMLDILDNNDWKLLQELYYKLALIATKLENYDRALLWYRKSIGCVMDKTLDEKGKDLLSRANINLHNITLKLDKK